MGDVPPCGAYADPLLNAEGGCLAAHAFAQRAGVSIGTIARWRRSCRVLGLDHKGSGYVYPVWQVVDSRPVPGLPAILTTLSEAGESDRDQLRWLLRPNTDLGGKRPVDLLRNGQEDDVIWAAEVLRVVRR